jgi:post-segregation antitoxin (ccd killing protein)
MHMARSRRKPRKKAASLRIDTKLLAAARLLDIYLSATLESALVAELRRRKGLRTF